MKVSRLNGPFNPVEKWRDWHVLLVGEEGFSMLNIFAEHMYGIPRDVLIAFANKINDEDQTGTLYPAAPVSAIPRRYQRPDERRPGVGIPNTTMADFRRHIGEFVKANRLHIRATRVLVTLFMGGPYETPRRFTDAIEEVFRAEDDGTIEELVIA